MSKYVQMIMIDEEKYLFITGFDGVDQVQFRVSHLPKYLQTETITIEDDVAYTNLYHFHAGYLKRFLIGAGE